MSHATTGSGSGIGGASSSSSGKRRTPRQARRATQARILLSELNKRKRMEVIRQTAHQALIRQATMQARNRGFGVGGGGAYRHPPPDRLLVMRQAVKEALLRNHSREDMGRVTHELLASAARKNQKSQAARKIQMIARGFLIRKQRLLQ